MTAWWWVRVALLFLTCLAIWALFITFALLAWEALT